MAAEEFRRHVLRSHGADEGVMAELLAYTSSGFGPAGGSPPSELPLPDEPFVEAWKGYTAIAEEVGVWETLRERLVQLRFPVETGISRTPDYQAAVRRGVLPRGTGGLRLAHPDRLELRIHPTAAGSLPVLIAEREDFELLVQALVHRNERVTVPPAMGACIVGGYNNWDRVGALRRAWSAAYPREAASGGWAVAFRTIAARPELYRDRFVVLSRGPYSGVSAARMGLPEQEWRDASLVLRLEHECAHYFTRRVFGSMRDSLHDELIADYAGITAVAGRFRADWFRLFLGLEDYPGRRPGGRAEAYRGTPPLTDQAREVVYALVLAAAANVERMDASRPAPQGPLERADRLRALCIPSLEELASGPVEDCLVPPLGASFSPVPVRAETALR